MLEKGQQPTQNTYTVSSSAPHNTSMFKGLYMCLICLQMYPYLFIYLFIELLSQACHSSALPEAAEGFTLQQAVG